MEFDLNSILTPVAGFFAAVMGTYVMYLKNKNTVVPRDEFDNICGRVSELEKECQECHRQKNELITALEVERDKRSEIQGSLNVLVDLLKNFLPKDLSGN